MPVCIATTHRRSGDTPCFSMVLLGIAMAAMGLMASTQAVAGYQSERVFADGFEPELRRGGYDILLVAMATTDSTCPVNGHADVEIRPGTPVRFCYRLENHSDVMLDWHELYSVKFGAIYQGTVAIAPGQSVVFEDPGAPRVFNHRTQDVVHWKTGGGGRYGADHKTVDVKVAPDIELFRFLASSADGCPTGIQTRNPDWAVSGYTALTVAPADLVTHCFRARNAGMGTTSLLTDNVLVDSLFGQLLNHDSQSFENMDTYTVAAQDAATTSMELDAEWSASDGVDTVSAAGHSSLYVTPNPACDGIRQGTSYDYVQEFYGIQIVMNFRLEYDVNASPARPGEQMTVHAHGAITSLQPDGKFGPRRDTRVYLSIPAGIDLARPFEVQASINEGVPISANLDVAKRMLVLSTGPVEGAPAEIDLDVTAYVAAAQTQPIVWQAPKLQMDIEMDVVATTELIPDRRSPPVLTTPLCLVP